MEKGPTFWTLNQALVWGEVPSPKSIVCLYLLSLKFDKNFQKQNKNLLFYFPFFIMRGKNILTPYDKLKG